MHGILNAQSKRCTVALYNILDHDRFATEKKRANFEIYSYENQEVGH